MLITTSNDLPGYEIVAVQGEIFGLTVRSRNIGAGCLAGLRSIGTACWVAPVSEAARQQYDQMVTAGEMPHQQAYETKVIEWGRSQGQTS